MNHSSDEEECGIDKPHSINNGKPTSPRLKPQTYTGRMLNNLAGFFFTSQKSRHHSLGTSATQSILASSSATGRYQANSEDEPVVCFHPYTQTQDHHQQRPSSILHCSHNSYPASSDSDFSTDSIGNEPSIILESSMTKAIAKEGTHLMSVKKATIKHDNPDEDYRMLSNPRGICLIVNNIDFEADIFPTRKGSDEDARRFDDIFKQLGFIIVMRKNQTAEEMKKLFKEVAADCKPEHDALFVFILSHGSEHGIYGTDCIEVHLEHEIIPCFDNRHCEAMRGKPKVFVMQACRGRSKDSGGDIETTDSIACSPPTPAYRKDESVNERVPKNRVPDSWYPSSQRFGNKKRKHPERSDMLLVFSCLAGYVSVRNELVGSWLGVALAYFIMTHAHEKDLIRILNLVTSDVLQRESSNGHVQSIETKLLGWHKNLYFNPGF